MDVGNNEDAEGGPQELDDSHQHFSEDMGAGAEPKNYHHILKKRPPPIGTSLVSFLRGIVKVCNREVHKCEEVAWPYPLLDLLGCHHTENLVDDVVVGVCVL